MAGSAAAAKRERPSGRIREAIAVAAEKGLLKGTRSVVVRGRMPAALVAKARQRTGIKSDSKLIEAALASVAVADDYGEFLISKRGVLSPDLDLEF